MNKKPAKKSKSAHTKAESAWRSRNFQEAYRYFRIAERISRTRPKGHGDGIFFMQGMAVHCIEKLLDSGHIEFLELYAARAKSFFREWNEQRIAARVSRQQRQRAEAFYAWRARFFMLPSELYSADMAVRQGSFEEAHKILQGLVEKLGSGHSADSSALSVIARSRMEEIILLEAKTPGRPQNFSEIANRYKAFLIDASYRRARTQNGGFESRPQENAYFPSTTAFRLLEYWRDPNHHYPQRRNSFDKLLHTPRVREPSGRESSSLDITNTCLSSSRYSRTPRTSPIYGDRSRVFGVV